MTCVVLPQQSFYSLPSLRRSFNVMCHSHVAWLYSENHCLGNPLLVAKLTVVCNTILIQSLMHYLYRYYLCRFVTHWRRASQYYSLIDHLWKILTLIKLTSVFNSKHSIPFQCRYDIHTLSYCCLIKSFLVVQLLLVW